MPDAPTATLDIRQIGTPWGILKVGQAIRGLAPGQILEVLGSDPALKRDLPRVVAQGGGRLCGLEQGPDFIRFLLTPAPKDEPLSNPASQPPLSDGPDA